MTSYAARKTRMFREGGDVEICKKRSDGRMKTYPSATDARSWVTEREERRQHILELVRRDCGKGMVLGKYVPIDVLIDTLLANKNADIERLRCLVEELKQLLMFYEQLNLTPEQRDQIASFKDGMQLIGSELDRQSRGSQNDDGPCGSGGARSPRRANRYTGMPNNIPELKSMLANCREESEKQRDLARKAIEKLEALRDIIEERDNLKKSLECCQSDLDKLRNDMDTICPGQRKMIMNFEKKECDEACPGLPGRRSNSPSRKSDTDFTRSPPSPYQGNIPQYVIQDTTCPGANSPSQKGSTGRSVSPPRASSNAASARCTPERSTSPPREGSLKHSIGRSTSPPRDGSTLKFAPDTLPATKEYNAYGTPGTPPSANVMGSQGSSRKSPAIYEIAPETPTSMTKCSGQGSPISGAHCSGRETPISAMRKFHGTPPSATQGGSYRPGSPHSGAYNTGGPHDSAAMHYAPETEVPGSHYSCPGTPTSAGRCNASGSPTAGAAYATGSPASAGRYSGPGSPTSGAVNIAGTPNSVGRYNTVGGTTAGGSHAGGSPTSVGRYSAAGGAYASGTPTSAGRYNTAGSPTPGAAYTGGTPTLEGRYNAAGSPTAGAAYTCGTPTSAGRYNTARCPTADAAYTGGTPTSAGRYNAAGSPATGAAYIGGTPTSAGIYNAAGSHTVGAAYTGGTPASVGGYNTVGSPAAGAAYAGGTPTSAGYNSAGRPKPGAAYAGCTPTSAGTCSVVGSHTASAAYAAGTATSAGAYIVAGSHTASAAYAAGTATSAGAHSAAGSHTASAAYGAGTPTSAGGYNVPGSQGVGAAYAAGSSTPAGGYILAGSPNAGGRYNAPGTPTSAGGYGAGTAASGVPYNTAGIHSPGSVHTLGSHLSRTAPNQFGSHPASAGYAPAGSALYHGCGTPTSEPSNKAIVTSTSGTHYIITNTPGPSIHTSGAVGSVASAAQCNTPGCPSSEAQVAGTPVFSQRGLGSKTSGGQLHGSGSASGVSTPLGQSKGYGMSPTAHVVASGSPSGSHKSPGTIVAGSKLSPGTPTSAGNYVFLPDSHSLATYNAPEILSSGAQCNATGTLLSSSGGRNNSDRIAPGYFSTGCSTSMDNGLGGSTRGADIFDDPCRELYRMDNEIQELRCKGELTPEQEAQVIRKELGVLKKYCDKLSNIQVENKSLKKELENLKDRLARCQYGEDNQMERDPGVDECLKYREQLALLQEKMEQLNDITAERDRLQASVSKLEMALEKYSNLPEDVEVFKEKSRMLDELLVERDSLASRLAQMEGMEKECKELKNRADLADDLQRQLELCRAELCRVRTSSQAALRNLKEQQITCREVERLKAEMVRGDMENEKLRYRAKEADVLRVERDRLKDRLDELKNIECEYLVLAKKMQCFDSIKRERDTYKKRCEDLDKLQCECENLRGQVQQARELDQAKNAMQRRIVDCECIIADQENEINSLVQHIERLSTGKDEQQERMRQALSDLRGQVDGKNKLLNQSQEQIAHVQDQLKSTIDNVFSETETLKQRIKQLEAQNIDLTSQISCTQNILKEKDDVIHGLSKDRIDSEKLKCTENELAKRIDENEKLRNIVRNLEGTASNYNDLDALLEKSQNAVQKVAEELQVRYQELDSMQDQKIKGEGCGSIDLMKKRMQVVQCENEKLKKDLCNRERTIAENKALRLHSSEIQDMAKKQIEDLIEELKKSRELVSSLQKENCELKKFEKAAKDLKEQLQIECIRRQKADAIIAEKEVMIQKFSGELNKSGDQDCVIKNLEARILELEEKLEACGDQVKDLERKVKDVEDEKKGAISELEENLKQMTACLAVKEKQVNDLKTKNKQLNEKLQTETENNDALKREAQQKVRELELKVKSGGNQNDCLVKDIQSQADEVKEQLCAAELKSEKDTALIRSLETQLVEGDKLRLELEDQIHEKDLKIKDLSAKLNKKENEVKTLQSQLDTKEAEIKEKDHKIKEFECMLKTMEEKYTTEIENLKNHVKELEAKVCSLLKQVDKLKIQVEGAISLESQIRSLKCEKENLRNKVSNLERELCEYKTVAASLEVVEAQVEKDEMEKRALNNLIGDLEFQLKNIAALDERHQAQTASCEKERTGLQSRICELERLMVKKEAEAEDAAIEQRRLMEMQKLAASEDMENSINALQAQLNKEACEQRAKDDEIERMNRLKCQLERDLQIQTQSRREAESKLKMKQVENNQLNQQVKDLECKLKSQIACCDERVNCLEAEISRLKKFGEDMERKLDNTTFGGRKDEKECERKIRELQDELECRKKSCNDTICSMKAQFDREIKCLHNRHNEAVAKLQTAHEDILRANCYGNEKVLDDLREELQRMKCENSKLLCESMKPKKCALKQVTNKAVCTFKENPSPPCVDPVLKDLLVSSIYSGFEALNFQELQFMHTKICDATAKVLDESCSAGVQTDCKIAPMKCHMPCASLKACERQQQAQLLITSLQNEINQEKEKLHELKDTLDHEKETNLELIRRIRMQSMATANMKAERDSLCKKSQCPQERTRPTDCEKARVRQLEDALERERENNMQLKSRLEKCGNNPPQCPQYIVQSKTDEIDKLRFELNKALTNDMMLRMQMEHSGTRPQPAMGCTCGTNTAVAVPASKAGGRVHTTTFYTELTVEDANKKKHLELKRAEAGGSDSPPSRDFD